MDRKKELFEARKELIKAIGIVDDILIKLNNAKSWGFWDLLGGGFISSMIKRDRISQADEKIQELKQEMQYLDKELKDVNIQIPMEVDNSLTTNIVDTWFDNIFTDVRVQSEISNSINEFQEFKDKLEIIKDSIDKEISVM